MSDEQRRAALAAAAKRAYDRRLQLGNGGNVSARSESGTTMFVTASGGSLGDCTAASFLETDLEGTPLVAGAPKPTRETLMHGRIYAARAEVGGIVHVHSPWAVAWSHEHDELPKVTRHANLKLAGEIPVIDAPEAFIRAEDWGLVEQRLANDPPPVAFLLRDHGVVALGPDPFEAEHLAELIEETAQVACLQTLLGGVAQGS